MRSVRSVAILMFCVVLGIGLTACATDGEPTAEPVPVTSTVTVQAPSQATPAPTSVPTITATETPETCSTDGSAAISAAMAQIPPPLPSLPDAQWIFQGNTNYNTCNDLSYAVLETSRGTASSPSQLLMFHLGQFVGPAIACNLGFQTVTGSSPTSVDVTYRWPLPGEPNADPSGRVDVSFVWDGSQVVMNGSLPYEVTRGQC